MAALKLTHAESEIRSFARHDDESLTTVLVRHGYIGNAPLYPTRAFSIHMLQLFHTLASRCPQLSLQKFIRGLCDLQRVSYLF